MLTLGSGSVGSGSMGSVSMGSGSMGFAPIYTCACVPHAALQRHVRPPNPKALWTPSGLTWSLLFLGAAAQSHACLIGREGKRAGEMMPVKPEMN